MRKVKNTIRAYITNNLEHNDQFNSISSRLNLHKAQKKEKYNYMKISKVLKLAVPIFLVIAVAVIIGVSLNNPHVENPKEPVAVVQMDVNPSISLVVGENNTVLSVYGENDEGKMIISDEEIVGMKLNVAIENIVKIEVETGYLVKGDAAEENKITISIEAETNDIANAIKTTVETKIQTICDELKIEEKLEVIKNDSKELLVKRALELDPTLSEEEASEMTSKQLIAYIKGCQLERINIPTQEIEELYNRVKLQKIQLVEKEETKEMIDKLDATYQTIKSGYQSLYQALLDAQTALNDGYVKIFIDENSEYCKAVKNYQTMKQEILKLENEIASMEDSILKAAKIQSLSVKNLALDTAYLAITTAKEAANLVVTGLSSAIDLALNNLDDYINQLPSEIKTSITSSLTNLEQKINEAKDNAFTEFENNYKTEIEAAYNQAKNYKQNLITQLKSVNQMEKSYE